STPDTTSPTPVTVSTPTRAAASGGDVIYTHSDGTRTKRTGGTRAWRNNNPGNIRDSKFARRAGAIGAAGGFAVFPDTETGMAAIAALLRSDSYRNLTVGDAIGRYAPPHENDTRAYQRYLERLTGLRMDTPITDLSNADMARVTAAIQTVEGWTPGREIRM
ncbi:MAG: conjugal transfer protein, partial [Alphaproteobacteria bacterium]|nr:conjugal transfer protein [Alphaproteobacteria bacterium]